MIIFLDSLYERLQHIILALISFLAIQNIDHHVVSNLSAPGGHLLHHSTHHRHQLRDEVDHAAVVHLPEDLVELGDIVVVFLVVIWSAGDITEVAVENIAASLTLQNINL